MTPDHDMTGALPGSETEATALSCDWPACAVHHPCEKECARFPNSVRVEALGPEADIAADPVARLEYVLSEYMQGNLPRDDVDAARSALYAALAAQPAAEARPVRNREADRERFTDPEFNRWLDEGISDAGHTVWDAVGDVQAAWQGWNSRQFYAAPPARPVAPAGWIACDERMPGEGAEVLVWVVSAPGNGYAAPDQWIEYHEDPTGMGGPTLPMGLMWRDNDPDEVTHWMPLPPPPGASPAAPAPYRAEKIGGSFQHTGTVVAEFRTLAGEERIVLEFDPPVAGMLHVYRPDQVNRIAAESQAAPAPVAPVAPAALEAPAELRGLDTSERVRFYEHDFYVLSNFSAFNLEWRGLTFQTSEAAYHWEKFGPDDGEFVSDEVGDVLHAIMTAPSAHEAFKIAEVNKPLRRPDWDEVKVGIMRDILRAKAAQHEYVRRKLLATGDRELVEDSWRDDFWGWGPNRDGKNMLGRLWMEVRSELRAHGISAEG